MAKTENARQGVNQMTGRRKIGPASVVVAVRFGSLLIASAAVYLVAFFSAVRLVPSIMAFVASGSGVSADMPLQTLIAAWIAPSLFLIALLFALVLVVVRGLWRMRRAAIALVSRWALGGEAAAVPASEYAKNVTPARTRGALTGKHA